MASFNPLKALRDHRDRPDRALFTAVLLAAAGVCILLASLPQGVVATLVGTVLPSSSRSSTVRSILLDHHRLLFGLAGIGLLVTTALVPAALGMLERFLGWLAGLDRRVVLVALLGVVVLSRLLLIGRMEPVVPGEDTGHYYQLANTLLDEGRFIEYASHPDEPDGFRAWRLPGYPAAWSVVLFVFGRHEWTAVLLNTTWMVVLVLSIYGLTRHLASEGAARLAAFACALYPTLISASLRAMNEIQFAALLALAAYLLFAGRPGWKRAFAGGLALGFATLTRGNGLPILLALLVAYPLYLFFEDRSAWRPRALATRSGVLALGFLLTITPWMVRNRIVLGEWVAVATSGGANMWIGHHPGGTGVHRPETTPRFPVGAGEVEMSRYGASNAIAYWLDEPLANLKIGARVVVQILKVDHGLNPVIFQGDGPSGPVGRRLSVGLFVLFNLVYYSIWGLVAYWVIAWLLGRWPPDQRPGVLIFVAALYVASYIPFIGWSRYKVPALPFLVAAAVIILAGLAKPRQDRSAVRPVAGEPASPAAA